MMSDERTPLLNGNGRARDGLRARFSESIDPAHCDVALTLQCAIAGAADTASYSQTGTWVGFMTGNLTQLTIAATTLVLTHPLPKASLERFALSSSAVLGFIVGSLLSTYIDTRFHGQHRGKLVSMALLRAVIFAAVAPWIATYGWAGRGTWLVLFLMALSMGSMAVSATRLGSTPYSTTVVFTASLASLFSDTLLPYSLTMPSKKRAISIGALVLGGTAAQTIMLLTTRQLRSDDIQVTFAAAEETHPFGSALSIALTAVLELFCALAWFNAKAMSD